MSEGRPLIFPQAVALGARPLAVPGRGPVLAVSAFHAFRLSDGGHVLPATWYETVAAHVGANAVPDSLSPLPGAELLVLGAAAPLAGDRRTVSVRCGGLAREVVLQRDPKRPEAAVTLDAASAVWHAKDNPVGRGGPGDDRMPLIVDPKEREHPIWFGPTPFDHPLRTGLVGTPDEASGTGWPSDADAAVLYEAHPAFWTESISAGDPLVLEGLAVDAVDGHLPPYRMSITSGRDDGRFRLEPARIHGVTVIPGAGMGAVFWRVAIDVGEDLLGESIVALIAALEDADASTRDAEHWGGIAVDRWLKPETAADDRPLLPAAMAAAVTLPFAMPEDDPMKERHAAAEAWMHNELGLEENPFADKGPEETALAEKAIDAEMDEAPPDPNAMGGIADEALAFAKQRHEEAGFKAPEEQRPPERRDAALDAEVAARLAAPYRGPRERAVANAIRDHKLRGMDADEVLGKLAGARLISPEPATPWPAFEEDEARRFGDALSEHLGTADLLRHVDVAGAMVIAEPGGADAPKIVGRRFDGLFAEETAWEGTTFSNCEFLASSFCKARFTNCTFRQCNFRETNLSKAVFTACAFESCRLAALRIEESGWSDCQLMACTFEDVSMNDVAMSDNLFEGGSWRDVSLSDGLLINMIWRDLTMESVTFAEVFAPQSRLERVSLHKFWSMGQGFAGSTLMEVEADTCGFLGFSRFDNSTFSAVRFIATGFTNAVFSGTRFEPNCRFHSCDLSGANFADAVVEGVGFVQCPMTGSKWSNTNSSNACFYGALLRGVDFADTELANAVFADADLDGTRFQADKTIGADFRGTVKAD